MSRVTIVLEQNDGSEIQKIAFDMKFIVKLINSAQNWRKVHDFPSDANFWSWKRIAITGKRTQTDDYCRLKQAKLCRKSISFLFGTCWNQGWNTLGYLKMHEHFLTPPDYVLKTFIWIWIARSKSSSLKIGKLDHAHDLSIQALNRSFFGN